MFPDPRWLIFNIKESWRYRCSFTDFLKCLLWIYSSKIPRALRKSAWTIRFRYPRPIGGVRLLLRTNAGADAFIHSEVFEHRYYDLGLQPAPETVLDLGANIGLTSVYFAKCFPNAAIACVEPIPANLAVLRENLELNGVNASVFAAAANDVDGALFMSVAEKDYGHCVADLAQATKREHLEVEAISIPTIMQSLGWTRIGLLKVDIEGHEKVLLSSHDEWARLVDKICIECHEVYPVAELAQFADRFGFHPPQERAGVLLLSRE